MANGGVFFFVVGPSGVGKDTLIDGAKAALRDDARYVFATRTITRPAGAPGEAHVGVSEAEFAALDAAQQFLITWDAHGLRYGLPVELKKALDDGRHVIANGSRAVIPLLVGRVDLLVVIEVNAPAQLLAQRIAARGRESAAEIEARLARAVSAPPAGVTVIEVLNDSTSTVGIERFLASIQEGVALLERVATRKSTSADAYRAKLAGATLDEAAYAALIDDLARYRYCSADRQQILCALITGLRDEEVVALARVRTRCMPRLDWGEKIVADKHSLGGVPGSRVTLIVVPIVTAYGLLMPKTSSRAITSASGTADAMEAAARVDLDAVEMRAAVKAARGCIVWNGRLNHSPVDDVTNAMVRPLGLDTRRWSVASILSKKYSAGATHVVVDLPYGPRTKLSTQEDAQQLGQLFERVGAELGMQVDALATDGRVPIGRGIGPALELRDVLQVLDGDPDAPGDLRDKALKFASRILAWDPAIGDVQTARAIAERLLDEGAARRAFDRIVDAQGRREFAPLSPHVETVHAERSGVITDIDGWRIAGLALQAGAPACKGAGIDLRCRVGDTVSAGDTLLRIHASQPGILRETAQAAREKLGIRIGDALHEEAFSW
jgi:thymidine phosphorylase